MDEKQFVNLSEKDKAAVLARAKAERTLTNPFEKGKFALRSALEGQTLGLSEPVIGATKAGLQAIGGQGTFSDLYQQDIKQRQAEKEAAPLLDVSSQIGGALIPSPVNVATKVGGALVKGGSFLSKLSKISAPNLKGLIVGGVSGGGTQAVIEGVGSLSGYKDEGALSRIGGATVVGGTFGSFLSRLGAMTQSQIRPHLKENADEILAAGKRLEIEPSAGQIYKSDTVGKLESTIQQSPPSVTLGGIQKQLTKRNEALGAASEDVFKGASGVEKYETGTEVIKGLSKNIDERFAPAVKEYERLGSLFKSEPAAVLNSQNLMVELSEGMPLNVNADKVSSILREVKPKIDAIRTLDDLKTVRTSVSDRISASKDNVERRVLIGIKDALTKDRSSSLKGIAVSKGGPSAASVIDEADKVFATQSKELMEALPIDRVKGKGVVSGYKEAVEGIEPLAVQDKFFNIKNVDQLKKFEKSFPKEFEALRAQRIAELQKKATVKGQVTPAGLIRTVKNLEPIQKEIIFGSKASQKIKDIETLYNSMPGMVGPSGTPAGTAWFNMVNEFISFARPIENYTKASLYKFMTHMSTRQGATEAMQRRLVPPLSRAGEKLFTEPKDFKENK